MTFPPAPETSPEGRYFIALFFTILRRAGTAACSNGTVDGALRGVAKLAELVQVTVVRCPRRAAKPIISYPDHPERGVHVRGNGYLPNPPVARAEYLP